ncbi:hypothetical protein [Mycobacterium nebraskense]|nr:hypothetical protein [Mycobacterium nebraskense]MBI2696051.1 hypothetical protein [Mycobacterium nebraskense]MCV7118114.1 hypothetical protein [Mycobacterium nebraskense]
MFAGWIDFGTTNPYLTVIADPLLLEQLTMLIPPWILPTYGPSDMDAMR